MTAAPAVSLVIVSHSRPKSLKRLLTCLRHQTLRDFQTIVVTNTPEYVAETAESVAFSTPNISAARNEGIAQALGEVVVFCDDDAVPEPAWLERLTAPFSDARVGAAGGFVRNRNGVAFQTKAIAVDTCGKDLSVEVGISAPWTCPTPPEGHVFKTIGTNCAFRLTALLDAGGFDTTMRYYLEEADLNIRLAHAGWRCAIVPSAEVHHGLHAGPHRSAEGVPKDLFEVGASLARFLQKHCESANISSVLRNFREERRRRLHYYRSRGLLTERSVLHLMQRLDEGFDEGVRRGQTEIAKMILRRKSGHWSVLRAPVSQRIALLACPFRRRVARRLAWDLAVAGHDVTLVDFRPGLRFLTVGFLPAGYWLHRGGSFGRGERSGPLLRAATVRQRCREELQRIAAQRKFDIVYEVTAWTKQQGLDAFGHETNSVGQPPDRFHEKRSTDQARGVA